MKYSTARWTAAFAAFALFGLPAAGWSQPPPPTSPTTSQQPPSGAGPEQLSAAQDHLRQAQAALNGVETASLQGKPKTDVTELKRHLNSLEKSTASASTTASKTAAPGKDNWSTDVSAIDKILTRTARPCDHERRERVGGRDRHDGQDHGDVADARRNVQIEIDGGPHARHRFRGVDVWHRAGSTGDG